VTAGRVLSVQPSILTSSIFQGITVFGIGFRAGNLISCNIAGPTVDFTGPMFSSVSRSSFGSSSFQEFSVSPWYFHIIFVLIESVNF
jgi:hypothetical protein